MNPKLETLKASFRAYRAPQDRKGPTVRPRLASSLVLYRGDRTNPEILMGCRHPRHKFMPSVYVFPGGAVDRGDSYAPCADHLQTREEKILTCCMSEARARATALASIRETFEETGVALGTKAKADRNPNHPGWQAYMETGFVPEIGDLELLARAITPPYRKKRFDTWFFIRRSEDIAQIAADSTELQDVHWVKMDNAEKLDIHPMTQMILALLEERLKQDKPDPGIPYSRTLHGRRLFETFPG